MIDRQRTRSVRLTLLEDEDLPGVPLQQDVCQLRSKRQSTPAEEIKPATRGSILVFGLTSYADQRQLARKISLPCLKQRNPYPIGMPLSTAQL